jgi:hypothetical protein
MPGFIFGENSSMVKLLVPTLQYKKIAFGAVKFFTLYILQQLCPIK